MLLEGFLVEILADGKPLNEYSEEVKEYSSTKLSYTCEESSNKRKISNHVVYASVPAQTSQFFKVRISSSLEKSNTLVSANVYVDGKYDYTYTALASNKPITQSYFENTAEGIPYQNFEFCSRQWIEENGRPQAGFFGVVTVAFHRARRVRARGEAIGRIIKKSRNTIHLQEFGEPLAALSLHYRSEDWLRCRGYSIQSTSTPSIITPSNDEHSLISDMVGRSRWHNEDRNKQGANFSICEFALSQFMMMTRRIFDS